MIMVVPITLIVPAVFVFVPPAMAVFPAPLSGFVELVSPVVRLFAVVAVFFNGAVQLVVSVNQPSLAIVACIRSWRSYQKHAGRKHRRHAGESDRARFPSTCIHGSFASSIILEAGLP